MPSFVRNIVIISICALFVISELTYNSQLLRAWRRGQQGGKPGTGSDAAEHLWRSSRLFFLSIGYTLLACFVFSVVVMVGLRQFCRRCRLLSTLAQIEETIVIINSINS